MADQIILGAYGIERDGDALIIRDLDGNVLAVVQHVSAMSEIPFPNGGSVDLAEIEARLSAAASSNEANAGLPAINFPGGAAPAASVHAGSGLFFPLQDRPSGAVAEAARGALEDEDAASKDELDATQLYAPETQAFVRLNRAPAASDSAARVHEDSDLIAAVKASDPDGDALAYRIVAAPEHGAVTLSADGTYIYRPSADYFGTDRFTFVVNDGAKDSKETTVAVEVLPINDAPVSYHGSLTGSEDFTITGKLPFDDIDSDTFHFIVAQAPQHGTLVIHQDGTFAYTPDADFNGSDRLIFQVADKEGAVSEPAIVDFVIKPVNDAPVADAGSARTTKDNSLWGAVTANDIDTDRSLLAFTLVEGPSHGTITLFPNGAYHYMPDAGFAGADSFTFQASDGKVISNVATIDLWVDAATDGPDYLVGTGSTLAGGLGNDTYIIESTADVVIENPNEGTDLVVTTLSSYVLGANVENLKYAGDADFTGTGNALQNQLIGGGGNDLLRGGNGNDRLYGNDGNDTLYGEGNRDKIYGGNGNDTVHAGDFNDQVWGDDGNDTLRGESGADYLHGGNGNDVLDGGGSSDEMIGAAGDDTYIVDHQNDIVTEVSGQGHDTVHSSVTYSAAGASIEDIVLTGSGAINATGNTLANRITGNSSDNVLDGGAGNDILDGGAGDDRLIGGAGADTFLIGSGRDTIVGDSNDTVVLNTTIDQAWLRQEGENLVLEIIGSEDQAIFEGWFGSAALQVGQIAFVDGTITAADIGTPPLPLHTLEEPVG